ncbi:MAG: exodeoxyribonuclease III [Candidatus Nomurabacteria bacterium]|jgi:exodeoxyribonuclease-3|nr:exodeoxyribonuclease III [Candidatus Nomurabacteria bacterium]
MKLFSWNVNGLRAVIQKGEFEKFVKNYQPDALCLQETKAKQGQAEVDLPGYEEIWNDAEKPGYSGTAIFTKVKPLNVSKTFARTELAKELSDEFGDAIKEGRLLTAEFEDFYLVNTYSPHTKRELERLPLKRKWDAALLEHMQELQKTKPVIACGDFNIAHQDIDLANPKQNQENAGFTPEERADFDALVQAGFMDTFRTLHPDETGAYTWWTWRANARARNIGWRIDYFLASSVLAKRITSATIHPEQLGSDHCPISLEIR